MSAISTIGGSSAIQQSVSQSASSTLSGRKWGSIQSGMGYLITGAIIYVSMKILKETCTSEEFDELPELMISPELQIFLTL